MKKMILTSTGLDNDNVRNEFLNMLNKPVNQLYCLFIPTAANDKESQQMIPLCFNELTDIGILPGNIVTYNCDRYISQDELSAYDVVYVCGGDENYLMKKINEINVANELKKAVEQNLIYIGVSAGSMITSNKMQDKKGLGLITPQINPHAEKNITLPGTIFKKDEIINLADEHAVVVSGRHMHLI